MRPLAEKRTMVSELEEQLALLQKPPLPNEEHVRFLLYHSVSEQPCEGMFKKTMQIRCIGNTRRTDDFQQHEMLSVKDPS